MPRYGIYARALRSAIGDLHRPQPHYGGEERRIEPHLLDFEGDLYGRRLVVELWERLRDEQAFGSEPSWSTRSRETSPATRGPRPV